MANSAILAENAAVLAMERQVIERMRVPVQAEADDVPGRWIEAYTAAGRRALEQVQQEADWLYLRIELTSDRPVRRVLTKVLRPVLGELTARGLVRRFWFLVKRDTHLHIRLRVFGPNQTLGAVMQALVSALRPGSGRSGVRNCLRLCYEPEMALFGGPWGLEQIHDLFHHDSRFALAWEALSDEERRGLSIHQISPIMLRHFLSSAGLDEFECWDVWNQVWQLRQYGDQAELAALWERDREAFALLLGVDVAALSDQLGSAARKVLREYTAGLRQVGSALGEGQRQGLLERGLRRILATSILFHWNRIQVGADAQAVLAYFMRKATAPLESESECHHPAER